MIKLLSGLFLGSVINFACATEILSPADHPAQPILTQTNSSAGVYSALMSQDGEPIQPEQSSQSHRQDPAYEAAHQEFNQKFNTTLIAAGAAIGLGLMYFYGPALAFQLGYHTVMLPYKFFVTPSTLTYYFVAQPAAIKAGIAVASSGLTQAAFSVAGTGLGGYIGSGFVKAVDGISNGLGNFKKKFFW